MRIFGKNTKSSQYNDKILWVFIEGKNKFRKMTEKIIIFATIKQSAMIEEEKKTNDEEKTIPRPEGYNIVKYARGWVVLVSLFGGPMISFSILSLIRNVATDRFWLILLVYLGTCAIVWIIMRKITEVKVNLKISEEGLEQTRLSGSKIYPEYRLIKWGDMRRYYLNGRSRANDFLISVKDDVNFRISILWLALFEKQKDNLEIFIAFCDDFWGIAPEHDVHRAFFG